MAFYKLSNFFKPLLPTKYLSFILMALGFLGFLDATYLTIEHYKNAFPPCTLSGCETVLTSKFAELIPGIPTSLIGTAFYLVVIGAAILFWQTKTKWLTTFLFIFTLLGLGVGIFLVYLQVAVIHAYCQYCLASELIDFLLFDTAWWLYNSFPAEN